MANMERLLAQMPVPPDSGAGRPLDELLESDGILSGTESQRLRTFFTSNCMEPTRDLDIYGWAVMLGEIDDLKQFYATSLAEIRKLCDSEEAARSSAAQEIYKKRWGPTGVPVYNLILLATIINEARRAQQLAVARWLIDEVKVPVDALDLSGSTALHHAISTKPAFDPEYAQMLYDAGGNVSNRNRYGGTPAHEITIIWEPRNREVVGKAAEALKWFLAHGGNVDIADSDGQTARKSVEISRRGAASGIGIRMGTWKVLDDEDTRRKRLVGQVCTFCGREPRGGMKLLFCSRCKKAVYCSPGSCQKSDWAHHKPLCKKQAPA